MIRRLKSRLRSLWQWVRAFFVRESDEPHYSGYVDAGDPVDAAEFAQAKKDAAK